MQRFYCILAAVSLAACSKAPENAGDQNTAIVQPPEVQSNEGLVGKWCFKPSAVQSTWDMIEIWKASAYSVIDHFGDGSTARHNLTESAGGLRVEGSDVGDRYVLPSTKGGVLVVADNDGEIGRAAAMLPNAVPADCFSS